MHDGDASVCVECLFGEVDVQAYASIRYPLPPETEDYSSSTARSSARERLLMS